MTENSKPTVSEIINAGVRQEHSTAQIADELQRHYPKMSLDEMAEAFRVEAARSLAEAEELRRYQRSRRSANDNGTPAA